MTEIINVLELSSASLKLGWIVVRCLSAPKKRGDPGVFFWALREELLAMNESVNRYDEVPYPFHPYPQSHPDRLAMIGKLFGIQTKGIDRCRVLELGCGRGGNILPMAEQLPTSEFVGIELSETQANEARALARTADIKNVCIRQMNIMDIDDSLGRFDYILAHGVYSWVPPAVQEKILRVCASNLTERGVAYVSYNVNPGWSMRGMLRDMMCYHASRFEDPRERIQQARGLLEFITRYTPEKTAYGFFLQSEVNTLRNQPDEYLYHDHLSEVNDPIYFHQFAERCRAVGLQYLGESDISMMYLGHFSQEIIATVKSVASDYIQVEQYLDFLRNRMFRESLILRSGIPFNHELKVQSLQGLFLSTSLQPELSGQMIHSESPMTFVEDGTDLKAIVTQPLVKAAMLTLANAFPVYVQFERLLSEARQQCVMQPLVSRKVLEAENMELGRILLMFFVNGAIQLHSCPATFTTSPGPMPLASKLARAQLHTGRIVSTLMHTMVLLDEFEASVLSFLDGLHDGEMICKAISDLLGHEFVITGDSEIEQTLRNRVDASICKFSKQGLLLG